MRNVVGAHLFFGAGPLNWLNSLTMSRVKVDIKKIKSEGFTDIFLLIPWAEFLYDEDQHAQNTLKYVLKEAGDQDLTVCLRLSYLWESGISEESTYELLNEWPHNATCNQKLSLFLNKIKSLLIEIKVNIKIFISWEDLYWPIYRHWEKDSKEKRIYLAEVSGFNKFLDLINASEVAREIPAYESKHSILFASFFDNIIIPKFLGEVALVFDNIGFEYRVDSDHVGFLDDIENTPSYYHWSRAQPFVMDKLVYFHQNLGGTKDGKLTARVATDNFNWLLRTHSPMRNFAEKLPLIDQFNFIDTTERDWATLADDSKEMGIFLTKALANIEKKASGVVLWGYQDWPKDIIFNGSFNYGVAGWGVCEGVTCSDNQCHLPSNASLQQTLRLDLPHDNNWKLSIILKNTENNSAEISVSLGDEFFVHEIAPLFSGTSEFIFTPCSGAKLTILCQKGTLSLSKIELYDRIYSQGGKVNSELQSPTFNMFINEINKRPLYEGRFCIYCTSRSGSTMLSSALSRHPSVLFHGEAFGFPEHPLNVFGVEQDTKEGDFLSDILRDIRDNNPIDFLNKFIWNEKLLKTHKIGFKLKSEEAEEYRKELFDWIVSVKDVKIILVHRESFWERFISVVATIQEGRFNTSDRVFSNAFINLASDEVLGILRDALAKEAVYETHSGILKARAEVIEITYEEMISDWPLALKKVENFLEIEHANVEPFTSKLITHKPGFSLETLNKIDHELRETKYYGEYNEWRAKSGL